MRLPALDRWALIGAFALALAASPDARAQRAVPRGGSGGGQSASPAPHGSSPAPQGARAPSTPRGTSGGGSTASPSTAEKKGSGSGDSNTTSSNGGDSGRAVPYGRPRNSSPTGTATVRTSPPPRDGSGRIPTYYYPVGYYPWGYGGYGFGGYYGAGYYGGSYYGGSYYGGLYDPWGYGYPRNYSIGYADDGALRLKIKPNQASVFVDGYFAGQVDEFDGVFQRLHVESGPHRIEIRADGYEPLMFDVRILPDRTVTYSGELKRF